MKIEDRIRQLANEGFEEVFEVCDHPRYKENPFGKTFCLLCEKRLSRKNEEEKMKDRLSEIVRFAREGRKEAKWEQSEISEKNTYQLGYWEGVEEALTDILILSGTGIDQEEEEKK